MHNEKSYTEKDWKLFRNSIEKWREQYLEIKNKQIISILTNKDKTPTEQFWDAKNEIKKYSKILTYCFDELSRSKTMYKLIDMYNYGVISKSDLEEFSDELKERIYMMCGIDEE